MPAAKPKPFDPENCSTKDLARVLGINADKVSVLYRQRTILQNGKRGKYNLFDAVPKYLESIRTSGTAEAGERLKLAQRRKIEIQNDKAEGKLVDVDDVAATLGAAAAGFMSVWRAIPRRTAAALSTFTTEKQCRELLENENEHAREQLAEPIREFYAERGQALPDVVANSFSNKPTPAAKPRAMGKRKPNSAKGKRRTRPVAK